MFRIDRIVSLALLTAIVTACGAEIETTDGIKTTDPLYAEVQTQCGSDAIVLRVVDLNDDEALCCYDYGAIWSGLHCMTASGGQVTNPNSLSKIVQVSKQAKLQGKKKK